MGVIATRTTSKRLNSEKTLESTPMMPPSTFSFLSPVKDDPGLPKASLLHSQALWATPVGV
jgi:hypothetical protein